MAIRNALQSIFDALYHLVGVIPGNILVVTATLCIAFLASHLLNKALHKRLAGSPVGEMSLLINVLRIGIAIIVVFFLGENVFHLQMGGAMQALGVTTLIVSLGLQDLIKSIVAGMLIVLSDIVSLGDQVMIGDHRGEVMDIDWHQITIRDRDGIPHIIPNSELMGGTFMRLTGKMGCRHMFECDIAPGVNLQLVKTDIETLAGAILTKNGWIAEGYSPQVMFIGSSAFGTKASVRLFISDIEYAVRSMDAVMCEISNRGYLADCTHEVDAHWKPIHTNE